jgi:hypothetical protein
VVVANLRSGEILVDGNPLDAPQVALNPLTQ